MSEEKDPPKKPNKFVSTLAELEDMTHEEAMEFHDEHKFRQKPKTTN